MPYQDNYVGALSPPQSLFDRIASPFTVASASVGDWFTGLDDASFEARQNSPDATVRVIPRQIPAMRSPTDFQYAPANRSTTTVDIDGGSRLFSTLAEAARSTLLTGLDNLTNRAQQSDLGFTPQPTRVEYQPPATIAGFPIAGVIAVAVIGGFVVWQYS